MKIGMAKITALDGYGDPHKEGKDEESASPYPQGNEYFRYVRQVFVDFTQWIRDEAGNN